MTVYTAYNAEYDDDNEKQEYKFHLFGVNGGRKLNVLKKIRSILFEEYVNYIKFNYNFYGLLPFLVVLLRCAFNFSCASLILFLSLKRFI